MIWTFFDKETGKATRCVAAPTEQPCLDNEVCVEGSYDLSSHYYDNGEVVFVEVPPKYVLNGKEGIVFDYAGQVPSILAQRDYLLQYSDWVELPSASDRIDLEAWLTYRQALRDLPEQEGFPIEVIWPKTPSKKR